MRAATIIIWKFNFLIELYCKLNINENFKYIINIINRYTTLTLTLTLLIFVFVDDFLLHKLLK